MDSFANGLHCVYDHTKHNFVPFDVQGVHTPLAHQRERGNAYGANYGNNPSALLSDVSRPPHLESHAERRAIPQERVRRPRNGFMIFRTELQLGQKIDRTVERDNRHISKIAGHYWSLLSEEEKDVWRLKADQEKLAHMRKYPDYKFAPIPRKEKPVKRKVKRNGVAEESRCRRVADLLLEGKQGDELLTAVNNIDSQDFSPRDAEAFGQVFEPLSPVIPLDGPPHSGPFDIFLNPLLPPDVLEQHRSNYAVPFSPTMNINSFATHRPILEVSGVETSLEKCEPWSPAESASPIYGSPPRTPGAFAQYGPPRPTVQPSGPIFVNDLYEIYSYENCPDYPSEEMILPTTSYSSSRHSSYHQQSPNYAEPSGYLHSLAKTNHRHFYGHDSDPAPPAMGAPYYQDNSLELSPQRSNSHYASRGTFHPYACSPSPFPAETPSSPSTSYGGYIRGHNVKR